MRCSWYSNCEVVLTGGLLIGRTVYMYVCIRMYICMYTYVGKNKSMRWRAEYLCQYPTISRIHSGTEWIPPEKNSEKWMIKWPLRRSKCWNRKKCRNSRVSIEEAQNIFLNFCWTAITRRGKPLWLRGRVMELENERNEKIPGSLPSPGNLKNNNMQNTLEPLEKNWSNLRVESGLPDFS
jgi:hypothetical protein